MKLLYPNLYLESIYDLDFDQLAAKGIKGIITDLDNTLVAWRDEDLSEQLENWFKEAHKRDIKLCIVSNNRENRVYNFAEKVGLPAIPKAKKPGTKAFRKALDILELSPEQVAVLGDQIFTDVLGGNRLNMYTVLVNPIENKEFIGTKVLRMIELLVLKRAKKNHFID